MANRKIRPEHDRLLQSYLDDAHKILRMVADAEAIHDTTEQEHALRAAEDAYDALVVGLMLAGVIDTGIKRTAIAGRKRWTRK